MHPISTGDRALLFLGLSSGLFDVVDLNTGDVLLSGDTQDTLYEHDDRGCRLLQTVNGDMLIVTGGDDGRLKVDQKMVLSHNQDGVTDTDDDTNVASSFELLSELPLTSRVKALSFLPNGDILFGEGDTSAAYEREIYGLVHMYLQESVQQKRELKAFEDMKENEARSGAERTSIMLLKAGSQRKQCLCPTRTGQVQRQLQDERMRHLQM